MGHPFWSTSRAILFCLDHVRSMCSHWGQAWSRKTSLHLFEDVFSNPNPTSWATECVIRLFQPELFARTCFLDTNPVSKTAHTTKIFFLHGSVFPLQHKWTHLSLSLPKCIHCILHLSIHSFENTHPNGMRRTCKNVPDRSSCSISLHSPLQYLYLGLIQCSIGAKILL